MTFRLVSKSVTFLNVTDRRQTDGR